MSITVSSPVPGVVFEPALPTARTIANPQSMFSNGIMSMQNIMLQLTQSGNDLFSQMNAKSQVARDAQEKANQVEATISKLQKPGDKTPLSENSVHYMRENNIIVDGMTIDEFLESRSDKNAAAQAHLDTLTKNIAGCGPEGMEAQSWLEVLEYMDNNGITVDGKEASHFVWTLKEVGSQCGQKISLENMGKIRDALEGAIGLDKGDLMMVKSSLESTAGRASDFNQQSQLKLQQLMQNFSTSNQLSQSIQSMLAEMTKGTASAIR